MGDDIKVGAEALQFMLAALRGKCRGKCYSLAGVDEEVRIRGDAAMAAIKAEIEVLVDELEDLMDEEEFDEFMRTTAWDSIKYDAENMPDCNFKNFILENFETLKDLITQLEFLS